MYALTFSTLPRLQSRAAVAPVLTSRPDSRAMNPWNATGKHRPWELVTAQTLESGQTHTTVVDVVRGHFWHGPGRENDDRDSKHSKQT
jgi:hypothetical protein